MTCTDKALLIARTNEDFEEDVDLVTEAGAEYAAGRMSKERFKNIQILTGQNFNALGFAADKTLRLHLRPLDVLNQDWVHGVLSDGVLGQEVVCFMREDVATTVQDYEAFLKSDLRFPQALRAKSANLHRVFDAYRNPNAEEKPDSLRANASELLGLFGLLRHFIEKRFKDRPDELVGPRRSFDACCRVVDVIRQMKTGTLDPKSALGCTTLEDAVFDHLRLFIAAYGPDPVKPKHFLNHELAKQFFQKGVFDAFVTERLHLRVKHIAETIKNMPVFEKSVLGRVMQQQIHSLQEIGLRSGLRGKIVRSSNDAVNLANSLECASLKITTGDIVGYETSAGEVAACAADDTGHLFVIVKVFQWLGEVTRHSELRRPTLHLARWLRSIHLCFFFFQFLGGLLGGRG